jgi:chromosome segregation ATPase
MSARRLETTIEQLQSKTTSQLAELGKKTDAINRMKMELGEKNATIFALETREKVVKDELAAKARALQEAEQTLAAKQAELTNLAAELAERSQAIQESSALQTRTDASSAEEHYENALLRDRINGIAAEVAKLAMTLEGADSTIATILASDATAQASQRQANGGTSTDVVSSAPRTLVERIRALQAHAPHSPQAPESIQKQ